MGGAGDQAGREELDRRRPEVLAPCVLRLVDGEEVASDGDAVAGVRLVGDPDRSHAASLPEVIDGR